VPSRPVKIRTLLAALWIAGSCLLVVASGPIDPRVVSIVFINVGHGDAILVDYGDTEILIDAGTGHETPNDEGRLAPSEELLNQVRKYVKDGQIEMAVVTHPDEDHCGGFVGLLKTCEPTEPGGISVADWRVLFPSDASDTDTYRQFREFKTKLQSCSSTSDAPADDYLQVPKSVFNENGLCLFAIPTARGGTDSDARAPILILEYGGTALVLSGDSRTWQGVEEELRGRFQTVALLAPHHGHGEFDDFLSQMVPSPDIIIISDECVPSLGAPMVPCSAVYSTAQNGTIVLTTDGTGFDVCVQRGEPTQVVFFDVGQGDAILIDSGSQEILIDGGADGSWVSQLDEYVQGPLEVVVVTHPHTDHIGGLDEVLRAFDVLAVVTNGTRSESSAYANFASSVSAEGLVPTIVRRGDTIAAGQLCMNVLGPARLTGDANGDSLVLSLQVGATSFLFTGDIDTAAEAELLRSQCLGPVDVLKVAHHGSAYGTSNAFLVATIPTWAIYSAGLRNGYGHPAPAALARLRARGTEILGTDCLGTIVFAVDETTGTLLAEWGDTLDDR
jgi:beta-lactamase superfamily II metal-dependent hydrolase